MNRITAPLALATSAMLVGCSSPSHPSQQSATQLKGKAITNSDLPFGWAVSPPSTYSSVTSPCPAITSDAGKQLPAQAEADFQQSEDGPFLQEILASGSEQQAHTLWASVQQAPGQCSAPGSTATATRLLPMSFPSYGDESYALRLEATRSGVDYSGDVVVIRKGRVFIEVVVFGGGGVPAPASLVQQMVDKAVHKI
jgi:hypothetical protein